MPRFFDGSSIASQMHRKSDWQKKFYNQLADRVSEPKVIVMTTYQSEEDICRALQAGAKGYLIKGAALRQMREAVRTVAAAKSLTIAIEGD